MVPRTSLVEPPQEERILGLAVHPVSKERAVEAVVQRALDPEPGAYVCLTNVHTTVESRHSRDLREAVDKAFLSVPDGLPVAWILKHKRHRRTRKEMGK